MTHITPIRNDADYQMALAEIRRLWGAPQGTPEGDFLDVLMVLVDDHEARHHAIEPPHPIEAIKTRMAQLGLDRADLGAMLGARSGRVSEILSCQRRLTIEMIRILAERLGLSERCLLQPYELTAPRREPHAA